MKKSLFLLIAIVLSVSLFACGVSPASPAPAVSNTPAPVNTAIEDISSVESGESDVSVGDDTFIKAPEIIYTTSGSENGFSDTLMYSLGVVLKVEDFGGYDCAYIVTCDGTLVVSNTVKSVEWDKISAGNTVIVYFMYSGFSNATNTPAGQFFFADIISEFSYNSPEITLDEYNQIFLGMSYGDVVDVVGAAGVEYASSTSYGGTVKIYNWNGENDYSVASIAFDNSIVTAKTQVGLE